MYFSTSTIKRWIHLSARSEFRDKDRTYQIWQNSHSPKQIISFPFFRQKLEYIQNNPCTEHWQLCELPEQYPYSSASDYLLDKPGILDIEKIW